LDAETINKAVEIT
jgi:hypothetical protein